MSPDTAALIEAVREPDIFGDEYCPSVALRHYDALRAATEAVLRECVEALSRQATWRQRFDASVHARALLKKVRSGDTATLDGVFTAAELRAVADWFDAHKDSE